MTAELSKADRIRKAWSDTLDGIKTQILRDAHGTPWSIMTMTIYGKKHCFGASCVNGTSLFSLAFGLSNDQEVTVEDINMNSKAGDVRTLCDIMNGNGPAAGFVESFVEQMTFLNETEKVNLTPRLNNAWRKKMASLLEKAGIDLNALKIVSRDILVAPSSQSYAFYAKGASTDELLHKQRLEAASHFPFLTNLMATRINVRNVIDANLPLAPAIQSVMPHNDLGDQLIPAWMARRLNNPDMVPPHADALIVLSKMPPDKFPSTDREMIYANDIIQNLLPIMGTDPKALLGKSFNGKWEEYRNSLILAFADTRPPEGIPEASWEYLQKSIDFKAIQNLSRAAKFDDVSNAADVISRNIPLPPGTSKKMIRSFIRRKYAPNTGESALTMIRDTAQIITKMTRDRFVLPLAMNMADMISPPLTGDVLKQTEDIARELLTEGRSALNVVRQFRSMSNTMNALMNVGRQTQEMSDIENAKEKNESAGFHAMTEADIMLMQRAGAWSAGRSEWETLTGPAIIRDFIIVPLVSRADISREAEAMDHCIGDYHMVNAVNLEEFHYSLRRIEDGWPVHVVTFSFEPGGHNGLTMNDIKGLHNSTIIPAAASAAISEFVQTRINPIGFQMAKAIIRAKEINIIEQADKNLPNGYNICGYDWRDGSVLERVFDIYGPAMPKGFTGSLDAMIASPQALKAAKSIDPAGRSSVMKALTAKRREELFASSKTVKTPSPSIMS